MNLEGKVAIVTGGGTGLGGAITKRFIADGAKVVITGRREEKLLKIASQFPDDAIKICVGDVTDKEDRCRVIETALSFGKGLNVLVNNAAYSGAPTPMAEFPEEEWRLSLETNLTAPFLLIQQVIPHMLEAGVGSIVNISSLAALGSLYGSIHYCVTKGALLNLSKGVALDYGSKNIRCNAVCPGSFLTEMLNESMENALEGGDIEKNKRMFSSPVPLQRIADPDEIGGLVSFLASDDSSYLTGAVIPIDGGASIVDVQGAAIRLAAQ